jgi:hypothetical protein
MKWRELMQTEYVAGIVRTALSGIPDTDKDVK